MNQFIRVEIVVYKIPVRLALMKLHPIPNFEFPKSTIRFSRLHNTIRESQITSKHGTENKARLISMRARIYIILPAINQRNNNADFYFCGSAGDSSLISSITSFVDQRKHSRWKKLATEAARHDDGRAGAIPEAERRSFELNF